MSVMATVIYGKIMPTDCRFSWSLLIVVNYHWPWLTNCYESISGGANWLVQNGAVAQLSVFHHRHAFHPTTNETNCWVICSAVAVALLLLRLLWLLLFLQLLVLQFRISTMITTINIHIRPKFVWLMIVNDGSWSWLNHKSGWTISFNIHPWSDPSYTYI